MQKSLPRLTSALVIKLIEQDPFIWKKLSVLALTDLKQREILSYLHARDFIISTRNLVFCCCCCHFLRAVAYELNTFY